MEQDKVQIAEKYTVVRQCTLCGSSYSELYNIGRHMCRIHPGIRLHDKNGHEFYSCCGLDIGAYRDGHTTELYMAGCVAVDHMDTLALSLCDTGARLREIKSHSVIIIPHSMLSVSNDVQYPKHRAILYDSTETLSVKPKDSMLECPLYALMDTRHNHTLLSTEHNPYYHGPTLVAPVILNSNLNTTNTKQDTLRVNLRTVAEAFDRIGGGGGGAIRRRRDATPFMVIQRIDDNLNIHGVHSRLRQL